MNIWLISDTHFGHSNILRHCRRPANADEMMIAAWRRLVQPDDLLIHLGDVAWGFYDLPTLLSTLPGKKTLILGNHDNKSKTYYASAGFGFVCDACIINDVYFSHRPVAVLPPGCTLNIHGHLHNNVPDGYRAYPHCRLFSVEYTNYEPRQLQKLLRLQGKKAVHSPPWGSLADDGQRVGGATSA